MLEGKKSRIKRTFESNVGSFPPIPMNRFVSHITLLKNPPFSMNPRQIVCTVYAGNNMPVPIPTN